MIDHKRHVVLRIRVLLDCRRRLQQPRMHNWAPLRARVGSEITTAAGAGRRQFVGTVERAATWPASRRGSDRRPDGGERIRRRARRALARFRRAEAAIWPATVATFRRSIPPGATWGARRDGDPRRSDAFALRGIRWQGARRALAVPAGRRRGRPSSPGLHDGCATRRMTRDGRHLPPLDRRRAPWGVRARMRPTACDALPRSRPAPADLPRGLNGREAHITGQSLPVFRLSLVF
jgi:hypothetical protein